MRVSCREKDLGYLPNTTKVKVFVDGKEVKYCFTADEELGKAYCYAIDEDGQLIADGNNTIKEIELSGKVVITKE